MEMVPVVSSNIASAGYDPVSQTLLIEFRSGPVYQYEEVPEEVFQNLLTAPSIGKFFVVNIRNKFKYKRIPIDNLL